LNVRRWTTKGSVFMNDLILNKGFDLTWFDIQLNTCSRMLSDK